MQLKQETQTGLAAEIKIIPLWACVLATLGFLGAQPVFNIFFAGEGAPPVWGRVLLGLAAGSVLGCFVLLVGYISRDTRRRGMNPLLWTLLAFFIPNGLGILLYFVLRQPQQRNCSQCGSAVEMGFNFCPRCSAKLSTSCPHCQRPVGGGDVYCPYCGVALQSQTVPA